MPVRRVLISMPYRHPKADVDESGKRMLRELLWRAAAGARRAMQCHLSRYVQGKGVESYTLLDIRNLRNESSKSPSTDCEEA